MPGEVAFVMSGDERKAVEAYLKVARAEDEVTNAGKRAAKQSKQTSNALGQTSERAGDISKKAREMRREMAGALGVPLTMAAGVQSALSGVKAILIGINEEASKAAQSLQDQRAGFKRLAQVAESPEDFKRLMAQGRQFAESAGISPLQGALTAFDIRSKGLSKDLPLFMEMSKLVEDPGVGPEAVQKVKANFPKQAGTSRQIVNQMLKAAESSVASFDEFAPLLAAASTQMKKAGASPEEVMAAVSAATANAPNKEAAALRMGSLGQGITRLGIEGETFRERANIALLARARGLEMQERLGGKEGVDALRKDKKAMAALPQADKLALDVLKMEAGSREFSEGLAFYSSQREQIDELVGVLRRVKMETGGARDILAGKQGIFELPEYAAVERNARATTGEELAAIDRFGRERTNTGAKIKELRRKSLQEGESPADLYFRTKGAETAEFLGAGEQGVETGGKAGVGLWHMNAIYYLQQSIERLISVFSDSEKKREKSVFGNGQKVQDNGK